jgi:hypothetical protein
MFALCANKKLSRVSDIVILSIGRVQDDNTSAFFGSEILGVRIAGLHQRINATVSRPDYSGALLAVRLSAGPLLIRK